MHSLFKQLFYQRGIIYTTGAGLGFLMLRMVLSGELTYGFLIWNLFLAAVPLMVVGLLRFPACKGTTGSRESRNPIFLIAILSTWLLFLPNAPYILTDFIHLRLQSNPFFFLDVIVLSAFSLSGMLMALSSFHKVVNHLKSNNYISHDLGSLLFKISVTVLCSLGVYLGRILRWNSWNILNRPQGLALDLLHLFIHPVQHLQSWVFICSFSLFLILLSITIEKLIHVTSRS